MTDMEINLLTMRKYEIKNYRSAKKIKTGGERWRIAPQMMGNFSSFNPGTQPSASVSGNGFWL